jgi:hypothetical protein
MNFSHQQTPFLRFALLAVALALVGGGSAKAATPAVVPAVWLRKPADLIAARARLADGDTSLLPALTALRSQAEAVLKISPASVLDKSLTAASGNKHDYFNFGPYWWPDPSQPNGLPYIRRDGEVNPASKVGTDEAAFNKLCENIETLGVAYWFTHDERFAQKAATFARVWFLDPATAMNPNLQYAQAIPGVTDGRGIGLIESRRLAYLNEGLALLAGSPAWTATDREAYGSWLSKFYTWLTTSANGRDEHAAENNHGTWYDFQTAHLALVLGRAADAKKILTEGLTLRLAREIEPDGSQPRELARTKSLDYSLMNLDGLLSSARLAEHVGVDWWGFSTADGRSLRAALGYLAPYVDPAKPWPKEDLHAADRSRLIAQLSQYLRHRDDSDLRAAYEKYAVTSGAAERWRLLSNRPLTPP